MNFGTILNSEHTYNKKQQQKPAATSETLDVTTFHWKVQKTITIERSKPISRTMLTHTLSQDQPKQISNPQLVKIILIATVSSNLKPKSQPALLQAFQPKT